MKPLSNNYTFSAPSLFLQGLWCAVLVCTFQIAAAGPSQAKPAGNGQGSLDSDLVITAASNEVTFTNGEVTLHYKDNVVAHLNDILIKSHSATGMRKEGMWAFENGVTVFRGPQTIQCNRISFARATKLIHATGSFVFTDTVEKTRLTGKEADFNTVYKTFDIRGNPRLTKIDTASAETLVITGTEMSYVDSLKKATATKNVKIRKGKLHATCQLANYFTNINMAQLRTKPDVHFDINQVTGDSINLYFGKESLKSGVVIGNAHGTYIDTSGSPDKTSKDRKETRLTTVSSGAKPQDRKAAQKTKNSLATPLRDTMFTHIMSDSLIMTINDSGYLDSLWAYGKVNTKYYSNLTPNEANQANGKTMLLSFKRVGGLDYIKMWGNARSIYFVDEPDGQGKNEASGDTITVTFDDKGKARRLRLVGSARGLYYPQDLTQK